MLVKKIFKPQKVLWYVRYELFFSLVVSCFVWGIFIRLEFDKAALPFSVAAMFGGALAIFLGFRNNSAYGRWWEARKLWAGIVNSSRVFSRLVITFTNSHSHQENYIPERSEKFKKHLVHQQIAWVNALRLHLRGQDSWEELKPFLTDEDFAELTKAHNKPAYLQKMMGTYIYEAMANGTLGGFDSFQMEGQLLALANYQGGCERIKNTPLLRQYHFFTKLFLFSFIFILPFALINDFHKMEIDYMMIPVSIFIAFVFSVIAKVGEVNEDPFENKVTDTPLSALCNTVERDLKELLGETDLPPEVQAKGGIVW